MGLFSFIGDTLGIGKGSEQKAAEKARDLFANLSEPDIQNLALERLREVGDPRDFTQRLQDSEFNKIQEDPRLRQSQLGALDRLNEIAAGDGLTEADRARLEQIRRQEAVAEKGQRDAITQNAAARGVSGSGLELANQLAAQQGAADRVSARDLGVAEMAQNRALDAITAGGQLAGNIRGQEFNQAAQRASAQDIINRFNTDTINRAGELAFRNRQDIANANVNIANQQQTANRVDLPQQRFDNTLDLRGAQANAINRVGQTTASGNRRLGRTIKGVGQIVAGGVGSKKLSSVIKGLG